MIFLGIDPGTATTGYGFLDFSARTPVVLDFGVIKTPAGMPLWERLHILRQDMEELILQYHPAVATIEQLFFSTNVKTAISVAQARGVILEVLHAHDTVIQECTPMQLKNYVTGYGGADKKQVQECMKLHLNLKVLPKPDDAADALALAFAGQVLYKNALPNRR